MMTGLIREQLLAFKWPHKNSDYLFFPPAVEFAMNERFLSLNSRGLSMNDASELHHT